jgi:lipopolysaccharide transport system ATP-binding protein
MTDTVIKFEKLGKSYIIGHKGKSQRYKALRDVIGDSMRNIWSRISHPEYYTHDNLEEFWALKDLDLEVKEGDRLGIIGRNGAGKTTLLKVLSRITDPTAGQIKIKGRVASLLEVGTGFHPELTGRENIFLNGSILGMSRAEIKIKFDEIVDFAGVEQFLDTPVKRYSTGMHVRLGFSVAAHLEPEILVVDEVLAVGDVAFQKKCIGKMSSVAKEGRTILFVSHNMSSIEALCNRAILLESGKLVNEGNPKDCIDQYLENNTKSVNTIPLNLRTDRGGSGEVQVTNFRVMDNKGLEVTSLKSGGDYSFEISYIKKPTHQLKGVVACIDIIDEQQNRILLLRSNFSNNELDLANRSGLLICSVKNLPLALGNYQVVIFLSHANSDVLDVIEYAAVLNVDGGDYFGTGSSGMPELCKILLKNSWVVRE